MTAEERQGKAKIKQVMGALLGKHTCNADILVEHLGEDYILILYIHGSSKIEIRNTDALLMIEQIKDLESLIEHAAKKQSLAESSA